MISGRFGHFLDRPLRGLSLKIRIHPNVLSVTGFILTSLSAFLLPFYPFYAGLVLVLGSLFDMFDGIVARNRNLVSRFGAFLDSTLDRLSDGLLFAGLTAFFFLKDDINYCVLSISALIFSFLVSYTRARIEGLGGECTVGLAERPERLIFLIAGLLTGFIKLFLWLIFITAVITTLHRSYNAWRFFNERP